jgi:predicted amidohydrolase
MSTILDAADFFVEGYDKLSSPQYLLAFAHGTVDEWYAMEDMRQRRYEIRDRVLATGRLTPADVQDTQGGGPELFATLLGIDDAFAEVLFPPEGGCSAGMYEFVGRWEEHRILTTPPKPGVAPSGRGALLPKWSPPGRASGGSLRNPRDPFLYLTRVPEELWSRCQHVVVRPYQDITCEAHQVRVACMPFLEGLDELDVQVIQEGPHRGYRAQAANLPALEVRVSTALDVLVESGADIALLPECALSPRLLTVWRDALHSRRTSGRRTGRLKWLMAGTGLFELGAPRPASRATLLSTRDGSLIGSQDKQFGFSLQPHQIRKWGLRQIPLDDQVWDESIAVGTELTIFDSIKVRAAIAICEDVSRTETLVPSVRAAGVTLLMVPIFAREMDRNGWEESDAEKHMLESGAHVVVCNSIAVARQMRKTKQPSKGGQPTSPSVLSSLFLPSTSQLERYVEPVPGEATNGCDPTLFDLFAEIPPKLDEAAQTDEAEQTEEAEQTDEPHGLLVQTDEIIVTKFVSSQPSDEEEDDE